MIVAAPYDNDTWITLSDNDKICSLTIIFHIVSYQMIFLACIPSEI